MTLVQIENIFLVLLLLVVMFATVARGLRVPYPIILVAAGIAISLVPGIPRVRLQPDLILLIILPPLLFSAGWALSWREFRQNFGAISMLAFGLVTFTIGALCLLMRFALPDFTWKPAFMLGAVIAATDAVAATSLARKMGMPSHITELLEAESLLNDGTGLLAFQMGVGILVSGHTPGPVEAIGKLVFLVGGGALIGLATAALVTVLERWLNDGPIEIVISLLVPYVTYLLADKLQASGVIAVIACSMYMSRNSSDYMTPDVRLQSSAVWSALTFLLNGVVFILIGFQLPFVLSDMRGYSWQHLVLLGLTFSVALLVLRLLWLLAEAHVSRWFRTWSGLEETVTHSIKELIIISWGGMRGVLSLAAAVSLPYTIFRNAPFAQRSMIIFLTFSVIVCTIIIQGLTLPTLVRRLGLAARGDGTNEEYGARRVLLEAALKELTQHKVVDRFSGDVVSDLVRTYRARLDALPQSRAKSRQQMSAAERRSALLIALQAERGALLQMRDEEVIGDGLLRTLQRELDLTESRVHTGAEGL